MKPSLLVPIITPLGNDGALDNAALVQISDHLLSNGADGLVLFGTLGEGQSFSVEERQRALEHLVSCGTDPERIVIGIGATAQSDVIAIARHGMKHGVNRQLVLPPFFFKGIDDEGIYRWFATTIDAIDEPSLQLMLYDIPQLTQVALSPDMIARLIEAYGTVIHGLKDSVPDWSHVQASLQRFTGLQVFVGNEIFIPDALSQGGAGAISGLGNIAPAHLAAIATGSAGRESEAFKRMCALYDAISTKSVVPTVKALAGAQLGRTAWGVPRPPLLAADLDAMPDVVVALDQLLAAEV